MRSMPKLCLLLASAVFVSWLFALRGSAAGSGESAGRVEVRIDTRSPLDVPWPMTFGIPFARGVMESAQAIRILDAHDEVPAQVDVTATWPDGSIRWARAIMVGATDGAYQVEFGGAVRRAPVHTNLRAETAADGSLAVHTGAATYRFQPDRLLPEEASMDGTAFLSRSGAGAYLVDNQGRVARVAGPHADVQSEVVREGPMQLVIRREGWYVTRDGRRLARARAWFYFHAGHPGVRVTHSLIFTEDTNETWFRDYGIHWSTAATPRSAVLAFGEPGEEDLLVVDPAGAEVYMRQVTFPHFRRQDSRAVAVRIADDGETTLAEQPVAGDWAAADLGEVKIAVVLPWLAQAFPKEIAVDATGVRAAFWSGRDGRELDFRSETLLRDYWQDWANDLHVSSDELARIPSNAQGAARTHDLWLLPHRPSASMEAIRAQAVSAARPVLVTVDPEHFCGSEAIGWPMHPLDEERFPVEETFIRDFWKRLAASRGYNGFLAWGANPVSARRVSGGVDYGMRRHVWGLYGRSGSRKYHEFGKRYNRFLGDWEIAHWTAGKKFRGGFNVTHVQRPHYWASESHMVRPNNSAHDIYNWLLDYYMTGDECALEIVRMVGEAMLERWDVGAARWGSSPIMNLRILTTLYIRAWDERFLRLAEELLESAGWIDLDSPNGLTDNMRHGALSKVDRNALTLLDYYQATGYEPARQAVVKATDFQYRFDRIPPPVSYQNAVGLLLTVAHRWTGNDHYLRRVRHLVESSPHDPAPDSGPHANMHATLGLPAALSLLAKTDTPLPPYPLAEVNDETGTVDILFEVPAAGPPRRISLFARFHGAEDRTVRVYPFDPRRPARESQPVEIRFEEEPMFKNPDAARFEIRLPAGMPEGTYRLSVPGAHRILVQESDISHWSIHAPEGFLANWDRPYYFRVADGVDRVEMNLGRPMTVRGPDGAVLIVPDPRHIGRQSIPADNRAGVWSVHAAGWGFFRPLNSEPVFAVGAPNSLVSETGLHPAPWVEASPGDDLFVPGAHGARVLRLAGPERVRLPWGGMGREPLPAFPGREGTIEFWFRPNRATAEQASASHLVDEKVFFSAGSHVLRYKSGAGRGFRLPFIANLGLSVFGEKGETGFIGRHFFRAGHWIHIAACWRLPEEDGTAPEFGLFLNGLPMNEAAGSRFYGTSLYGYGGRPIFPRRPEPGLPGALRALDPVFTMGPIDGDLAQLRISDSVRYNARFEPQWDLSQPAEGRVAFFPLDGTLTGIAEDGRRLELELK